MSKQISYPPHVFFCLFSFDDRYLGETLKIEINCKKKKKNSILYGTTNTVEKLNIEKYRASIRPYTFITLLVVGYDYSRF